MAKVNVYVVNAYDQEGEAIIEDHRLNAMSDKAAWLAAVEEAFARISKDAQEGYLVSMPGSMDVTRL